MVTSNNCLVKARSHLSENVYRQVVDLARTLQEDTGVHEKAAIARAAEEALDRVSDRLEVKQSKDRDITQTAAFKKWFGDSKVVDADGKPLVVYHGATLGEQPQEREEGHGIWFAADPSTASIYAVERGQFNTERGNEHAANVVPAYLSMTNPLVVDARGARYDEIEIGNTNWETDSLLIEARDRGHDGLIVKNVRDLAGVIEDDDAIDTVYAVFRPEQIKSAIGNDGRFDQDSADITRSAARNAPQLKVDVPSEEWLQEKQEEAAERGRNKWGVPSMVRVTARLKDGALVDVPVSVLSTLRGQRDEQNKVRPESLSYLRENWDKVSKHSPYIEVAYNGEAWVSEGNHRIMVAAQKGLETLPVEIKYYDGGERVKSGPLYPGKIGIDAPSSDGNFDSKTADITRSTARDTSKPIFYSQLQLSIENVPERLSTMSAPQWKLWLDANASKLGVKKEEIEWSGIKDYLAMRGKDKVTSQELSDYLRDNGVQVSEVTLKHPNDETGDGDSKYNQYTVPGGQNYREVLITLPTTKPALAIRAGLEEKYGKSGSELYRSITDEERAMWDREKSNPEYRSSHWDESNILAHLRVDDRTDAEGKRVLFVNEIQSDWAQQGRKEGFRKGDRDWNKIGQLREDLEKLLDEQHKAALDLATNQGDAQLLAKREQLASQVDALEAQIRDEVKAEEGLPRAPFVEDTKSWVSLALKRAIMMATRDGYDKVAFVTGEQAADFFDLSKQIDVIEYQREPDGGGLLLADDLKGNTVVNERLDRDEKLVDYIGKEAAEKLLQQTPVENNYHDRKSYVLHNADLKVGGEGMRGFYDKIVPQVANEVLKKVGGGKVGEVRIAAVGKPDDYSTFAADGGFYVYRASDDTYLDETSEWTHNRQWAKRYALKEDARAVADDLEAMDRSGLNERLSQPGFEITDKMRTELEDGMPLFSAARAARDLDVGFGYKVSDFLDSSKKVSWWDKTVGTPYHLAQKNPTFKRVYDAIQNFIADVSKYATRAADLAPNILPKLEDMKDVFKSPLSAADVTALSDPIFKGTLVYTRDAEGNAVEAEDVGSAGIVWTDDELKSMWKLNGDQIALYREFRKATNKSIADLSVTGMLRLAGEDADGVRGRVLAATNVQQASEILADHLGWLAANDPERANTLQNTARIVKEQADEARGLMARGYAPLSRYGDFTVYAPGIDENGYFEMFESERDANRRARELRAEFPDQKITVGTMSKEAHKLFKGVTPETLALFGDALGLEESANDRESQVFQEYLKIAKSTRSAMKRLIHRKGVAGYSNDVGRVLAGFVYSNARQAAQNLNAGEILRSANEVPEGDLKDHAIRLVEYSQAPQEEMQGLRGLVFAQFIGGNVASALVNTTQSITTTWPTLSQHFGISKSGKAMLDALGVIKSGPGEDADLKAAMERAAVDGITDPNETHQLQGQAQGRGSLKSGDGTAVGDTLAKLGNGLEKLKFVWGKGFGLAEVLNRKIAFISAYKLAREKGEKNPYEFAKKIVNDSQFVMNKGSNPVWARGPVGATLFQFKKFSVFYLENLARMWGSGPEGKKAFAMSLAIMFLMAGMGGFPFADDLDDVIDGFAQRVLNKSFVSKQARKEFFASILGDAGANFVMSGITGLPGAPIDISGRLGLGNLIPATGLLVKKQNYGRDVQEIFGAVGTSASRALQAAGAASEGNIGGVVDGLVPVAVANALKAMDMIEMGQYRDQKGRKVIDTTVTEALLKGIGFQPASVKNVQEATATQQELIGLNKARETEIADLWAKGRIERKPELIEDAKRQMKEWNASNPTSPINIDSSQINKRVQQANMDKATRLAKTAPKEIRASVKAELQRDVAQ